MTSPTDIDFPEGGAGVILRLRPTEVAALSEKFEIRDPTLLLKRLDALDTSLIVETLKAAAKRNGSPVKLNVDAVDLTLIELRNLAGNALLEVFYGHRLGNSGGAVDG